MLNRRSYLSRSGFYKKPFEPGSRKWLIAELDKYTSIIVRRRDRRCVTCRAVRGLQCSHFYSRRHLAIRFNLVNCNAMCGFCNRRHNRDPFPYMTFMQEKYGPEAVEELNGLRASRRKVTDEELRKMLGTGHVIPVGIERRINVDTIHYFHAFQNSQNLGAKACPNSRKSPIIPIILTITPCSSSR